MDQTKFNYARAAYEQERPSSFPLSFLSSVYFKMEDSQTRAG